MAYLALIGTSLHFTPSTAPTWVELTRHLQVLLESRHRQGIVGIKASPYLGKLLAICLVVMYEMREQLTASDKVKTDALLNTILHRSEVYSTTTEKHIVASTLTRMMMQKDTIPPQQP